jgi:hypothetical protein
MHHQALILGNPMSSQTCQCNGYRNGNGDPMDGRHWDDERQRDNQPDKRCKRGMMRGGGAMRGGGTGRREAEA